MRKVKRKSKLVITITGTNGKTIIANLLKFLLSSKNKTIGLATTDGLFINGRCIQKRFYSTTRTYKKILKNPKVDIAILELAIGAFMPKNFSLNFPPKSDVSIVTNISRDHINGKTIKSIKDVFKYKSKIIENKKTRGLLILNAQDFWVRRMGKLFKGEVIFFSLDKKNPYLVKHLENKGKAIYLDKNKIFIETPTQRKEIIDVRKIPLTLEGKALFNIQNVMAVLACIFSSPKLNLNLFYLKRKLKSFGLSPKYNKGRTNMFDFGKFKIITDFAHNTGAFENIIATVQKFKPKRIVGVVRSSLNRSNEHIVRLGEKIGELFDVVYVYDKLADEEFQKASCGRKKGETPKLLIQGLKKVGPRSFQYIPREIEALNYAIKYVREGDIIIHIVNNVDEIYKRIKELNHGK